MRVAWILCYQKGLKIFIAYLFGKIQNILQDVWIDVALDDTKKAKEKIDDVLKQHMFDFRYQIYVGTIDWESCATIFEPWIE